MDDRLRWGALLALVLVLQPALAGDPMGSRYDNWDKAALWSSAFGYSWDDNDGNDDGKVRTFGDVNGDGLMDAVMFSDTGVEVALSNGQSFLAPTKWLSNLGEKQGWRVLKHPRQIVDLNFDGKADVVGFGDKGVYAALSDGTTFNTAKCNGVLKWSSDFGNKSAYAWNPRTTLRTLADVNGDNYPDVVGFGSDGVYVGIAKPTICQFAAMTKWSSSFGTDTGWNLEKTPRFLTDVNGDHMADIIGFGPGGVYVALAAVISFTGSGPFQSPVLVSTDFSGADWPSDETVRTIADVNGDGLQDLVGFGLKGVVVALSLGATKAWPSKTVSDQFTYAQGWDIWSTRRMAVDVNGDGRADLVGFGYDGVDVSLTQSSNLSLPNGPVQNWVQDFGANQNWAWPYELRAMVDVNGDGRPEPVGFQEGGIFVSPSDPLYCCDPVSFLDLSGEQYKQVDGALVARAYLPKAQLFTPTLTNPSFCTSNAAKNPMETIGTNMAALKTNAWSTYYPGLRLMMNANFFDLKAGAPYKDTCTDALGYVITNGEIVAGAQKSQVYDAETQTLAFFKPGVTPIAQILSRSDVPAQLANIQTAISGVRLLENGLFVAQPQGITPTNVRARAAIGLTRDGKTVIMVVVNAGQDGGGYPNGGTTLKGLSHLLYELGAQQALTLDGSGSAQMVFANGTKTFQTAGSDVRNGYSNVYRPVPIFLGVK